MHREKLFLHPRRKRKDSERGTPLRIRAIRALGEERNLWPGRERGENVGLTGESRQRGGLRTAGETEEYRPFVRALFEREIDWICGKICAIAGTR